MAILLRLGIVEFIYSKRDKGRFTYKMSRHVATMEEKNSSVNDLFSKKYFKSFDGHRSDQSDKDEPKS